MGRNNLTTEELRKVRTVTDKMGKIVSSAVARVYCSDGISEDWVYTEKWGALCLVVPKVDLEGTMDSVTYLHLCLVSICNNPEQSSTILWEEQLGPVWGNGMQPSPEEDSSIPQKICEKEEKLEYNFCYLCLESFFHVFKAAKPETDAMDFVKNLQAFSFASADDAANMGKCVQMFVEGKHTELLEIATKTDVIVEEKPPEKKQQKPRIHPQHLTNGGTEPVQPKVVNRSGRSSSFIHKRKLNLSKSILSRVKSKKKAPPLVLSGPTNFVHASHIGWDPATGFQVRNLPPRWKALFNVAGVSDKELTNPSTAKIIMETVASVTPDALKQDDLTDSQANKITEALHSAMETHREAPKKGPSDDEWSD
eukprot:TRINITY_DN4259_c0_g1_i1.p1 TRINITY_DN4259_c0_g1~~TRINITY_DN4259_c0_g1_i1.p1  ORF type:complete len:366 (+),score=59.39 TRINITY_DN4259_c0_g1_i1:108-1205(+)